MGSTADDLIDLAGAPAGATNAGRDKLVEGLHARAPELPDLAELLGVITGAYGEVAVARAVARMMAQRPAGLSDNEWRYLECYRQAGKLPLDREAADTVGVGERQIGHIKAKLRDKQLIPPSKRSKP